MGDWIDKKRGRSFKLGGKKSTYQAIIYEKGHEQRQKNVNPDAPLDWVRVSFGYIHQGIQGHGVEAPTGTDRTLWPVDGLPLQSPRSYLGPSGQARHRNKKPRCVESAENMYRQYQRKLAETVKDKYVPRAAHFAALKKILNGGIHMLRA